MTLIAFAFPKLRTPKMWLAKRPKKSHLREPLGKPHGKFAQELLKSASHHLYQIG